MITAPRFSKILPNWDFFSKNFKIIVESSQIARSIGNFIQENFKTGHFLIKWICEEIWCHMPFYLDLVTSYMNKMTYDVISSQIFTLSKMYHFNSFKIFQYKVCDRIGYLLHLYDSFEIFRKKFKWCRIFMIPSVCPGFCIAFFLSWILRHKVCLLLPWA